MTRMSSEKIASDQSGNAGRKNSWAPAFSVALMMPIHWPYAPPLQIENAGEALHEAEDQEDPAPGVEIAELVVRASPT